MRFGKGHLFHDENEKISRQYEPVGLCTTGGGGGIVAIRIRLDDRMMCKAVDAFGDQMTKGQRQKDAPRKGIGDAHVELIRFRDIVVVVVVVVLVLETWFGGRRGCCCCCWSSSSSRRQSDRRLCPRLGLALLSGVQL